MYSSQYPGTLPAGDICNFQQLQVTNEVQAVQQMREPHTNISMQCVPGQRQLPMPLAAAVPFQATTKQQQLHMAQGN
jgi:hypothetical protein